MNFQAPERFDIADYFLDQRIREGRGDRTAIVTDDLSLTYRDVQRLANRYANVLRQAGVEPEQRVIVALPDGPDFVGALFGVLKAGAVVVMVNPALNADAIRYFYGYTRARAAFVHRETRAEFDRAAEDAPHLRQRFVVGSPELDAALAAASTEFETFPAHRDDAAIWLFSGGTTGQPKAVVQSHQSFANTTECYAKGVIRYSESDVTLSVPKLFFGYATGSNLFFPFAAGATVALFPERCTAEVVFEKIRTFRPTILINVPTMIHHLVSHPGAAQQDLSCLRLSTSAGEALPVELFDRWTKAFGVELLDGLGTAEMWHIFLSASPGDVEPGTLGKTVPGFETKVMGDDDREVPRGEVGWLWVRGNSRAIGYWQQMERTMQSFRGEWYVTGDMVRVNERGNYVYCGRGDDMLKVGGKWLSPQEVENCLLQHPGVEEVAVVGVTDANGLVKPHAYVVANRAAAGLGAELQAFAREKLEPYKYPREVHVVDDLPRTHLGKVDRGKLKRESESRLGERAHGTGT